MVKWIGRFIGTAIIVSLLATMDSTIMYADDSNTAALESASPQSLLEQSIKSVKLADPTGKLNPASYQMQFVKDSKEFPAIDSIFPDRSGEHIIIVYDLHDYVYKNGEFTNNTIKVASIQAKDGKKVWDTVIGKKQFSQSIYSVQSNGEIFLTTEDKSHFYLHTIDEKTGKITRTISQPHPSKPTFLAWDYWLVDNNQLLVSYEVNNQSTLRYFDAAGKLLRTRTVPGIVRSAQADRILVTNGDVFRYTLSVQDAKGNTIFKKSIADQGFFWNAYLLPDQSVAVESQIDGKAKQKDRFQLIKYNARGEKQWQHTIWDEYSPYLPNGNQMMAFLGVQKKVIFLNDQGKAIHSMFGSEDGWMGLRNKEVYFTGNITRIADAKTMKWLMEMDYEGDKPQVAWLGKQQLAIYDGKNNVIAVIRIKGK